LICTFRHGLGPDPAGRPHLADLLEEVAVCVEEEGKPGAEGIDVELLAAQHVFDVLHAVAKREGQFLDRRGAGLADVVARNRDRVPLGNVQGAELDGVADQLHGGLRGAHEGLLGDELLEHVVLDRAADLVKRNAVDFGRRAVHGPEGRGRRVDRHGGRDLVEGDALGENEEVFEGVDGHAALAALATGFRGVGVIAHEGGEVEGRAETRLAFLEEHVPPRIGGGGISHAREHAECPVLAPVAGHLVAAGVGVLPGVTDVPLEVHVLDVIGGVKTFDGEVRNR